MFIRKRTYLELKEQNIKLHQIASDAVEQRGRLLDEVHQDYKKFKQFIDEYQALREDYCELRHAHDTLYDEYETMILHSQQLEQTIAEQEEIVKSYNKLVVERDYLYAKCKYFAKLLGIDEEVLDANTTSGEAEQ